MWAIASVPILVALALAPRRHDGLLAPDPVVITAQLAMLAAAVGFACHFHRTRSARSGWTSSALTVAPVAVGLAVVATALDERASTATGAVALCGGVTLVTLVWLVAPDSPWPAAPDHPVTTGVVAGALTAAVSVLTSWATPGSSLSDTPTTTAVAAVTCVVGLGALAARSIARHAGIPRSTRALLVVSGAVSAVATSCEVLLHPIGPVHTAAGVLQVAGWAGMVAVAARLLVVLADLRASDYQRVEQRVQFREQDLRQVETTLHEARSAVAGIASAHRVIADGTMLTSESRRRLMSMSDAEIARLERLLAADPGDPGDPARAASTSTGHLEDMLESLVESLRARGHEVELRTSSPHRHRDPDEVACIVHALLDNAARHGSGAIELAVEDHDEAVLITVTDHGPGVPPGLRGRLFDWGASGAGSSGIGLYDARSRARSLGGLLRLDDRSPGGTRFELELPLEGRLA